MAEKRERAVNGLRLRPQSVTGRLTLLLLAMLLAILLMNFLIFTQSRSMMHRIDEVFASNATIVDLSEKLGQVQVSVYEYLSTRSSSALENFYRYSQEYADSAAALGGEIADDEGLMLERNIRRMSENYLELADEAIQAKRGRNVEEYREKYDRSEEVRQYIGNSVYELNSLRFEQNSVNYRRLLEAFDRLEAFSLVLMAAVFGLTLVFAAMTIRAMISPLTELAGAADRVAAGDFDVQIPESESRDEVGIVTNAFRGMVASIRQYIIHQRQALETQARMKENELTMQAHLKEAQLKYLQAQINPHFLFNSLNAASQLAMLEGAERSEVYLARMADFFRYNVKKSDGRATLEEEIAAADNYIYILNVRFSGDIHYRTEIDPQIRCGDIRMPSMILQPLVENAIQHGIHDDHEHGRIVLSAERVRAEDTETGCDCIRLTVADNGAGMTRAQIGRIMRGETAPAEDNSQSTGIALSNVMSRLQLFYGREHLLSVWSDGPGCGTEVNVLLPLEEEDRTEE